MDASSDACFVGNLLTLPRGGQEEERFEDILSRPGIRLERIVSHGQTTPVDRPYVQDWDEWVMILEGSAELWLDGLGERSLSKGDHLLIPSGQAHRVTYTAEPTVWLALHLPAAG